MKNEQLKVALCGYLPYGVKVMLTQEGLFNLDSEYENPCEATQPMSITNIYPEKFEAELESEDGWGVGIIELTEFAPILHNLNCLTKPIIVKGYNGGLPFVPIEEIGKKLLGELYRSFDFPKEDELVIGIYSKYGGWSMYNFGDYESLPYWVIDLLNRWKIDYRNLIGQRLAIDVETLKENCYEH